MCHYLAVLAVATALAHWPSVCDAADSDFLTVEQRAEDFASFCRFVQEEYAYFDRKATDWKRACEFYATQSAGATDRAAYIGLLERALRELYDAHAHLGTNTGASPRLVPSQTDLVASWVGDRAVVTDVRAGSAAEAAGLRPGLEVVGIDGDPVAKVVQAIEPKFLTHPDPAAHAWALQVALAGRHDHATVRLSTRAGTVIREFEYSPAYPKPAALLSSRVIGDIGYIRVHNSLDRQDLIRAFDDALLAMPHARGLVIDLRDTPSGGNTSVARGIIGRFVARVVPYQRHESIAEYRSTGIRRIWVEYVAPRDRRFPGPVVALVGRWTGSMGEGIAIGLNGARGALVVGRPMAHLQGALDETVLPRSHIVVRIPAEKLFHVDETPREDFVPCEVPSGGTRSPESDPELEFALHLASAMKTDQSERSRTSACPSNSRRAAQVRR